MFKFEYTTPVHLEDGNTINPLFRKNPNVIIFGKNKKDAEARMISELGMNSEQISTMRMKKAEEITAPGVSEDKKDQNGKEAKS